MGYDLRASNKSLKDFHFGAFSWSWMLESGVGLVIGTGKATKPAVYSYIPDKYNRDPNKNDGFRVTAKQAKAMALVARGLVSVKQFINNEWNKMTPEKRKSYEEANKTYRSLYNEPVREDFLEKVEKFATWAEKSQGFKIE